MSSIFFSKEFKNQKRYNKIQILAFKKINNSKKDKRVVFFE